MHGKTLLAQGHRGETTPKTRLFLILDCFKYLLKCLADRYLVHSSHSNAWTLISSNMWNTSNSGVFSPQFNTQQLVSMLSDIIRRDPAAANQSPVSSAACWWARNDGVRGMPSTCADIISVTISFTTDWIFAIKRKSSTFTDSLTRDLFFVCLFVAVAHVHQHQQGFIHKPTRMVTSPRHLLYCHNWSISLCFSPLTRLHPDLNL